MNASTVRPVFQHRNECAAKVQEDAIATEAMVALEYNGIHYASLMLTPADIEDFARGFSLTEGVIDAVDQILDLEIENCAQGFVVKIKLSNRQRAALTAQRQMMGGRSGCGICGRDALRLMQLQTPSRQATAIPSAEAIYQAVSQLTAMQPLRQTTGASHAAARCNLSGGIEYVCEDIGRHNALDKLIGQGLTQAEDNATKFALLSSRASFEMVHKAAKAGFGTIVAMSAPTSLAIDTAEKANINLLGFARPQQFTIYHKATL